MCFEVFFSYVFIFSLKRENPMARIPCLKQGEANMVVSPLRNGTEAPEQPEKKNLQPWLGSSAAKVSLEGNHNTIVDSNMRADGA